MLFSSKKWNRLSSISASSLEELKATGKQSPLRPHWAGCLAFSRSSLRDRLVSVRWHWHHSGYPAVCPWTEVHDHLGSGAFSPFNTSDGCKQLHLRVWLQAHKATPSPDSWPTETEQNERFLSAVLGRFALLQLTGGSLAHQHPYSHYSHGPWPFTSMQDLLYLNHPISRLVSFVGIKNYYKVPDLMKTKLYYDSED